MTMEEEQDYSLVDMLNNLQASIREMEEKREKVNEDLNAVIDILSQREFDRLKKKEE